jgi:predicted  nucleic acid-binding Zn-ribbon protein
MNANEAAQHLRQLGELFIGLAPHLESAGTLTETVEAAYRRLAEITAVRDLVVAEAATLKANAAKEAADIRDAADKYAKQKRESADLAQAEHDRRLQANKQQAQSQIDALSETLTAKQTELRDLLATRDALTAEIAKHRAALAEAAKL